MNSVNEAGHMVSSAALRFRRAQINDAAQCAPLIHASGEGEFAYFLGVSPHDCIAFIESAFRSSKGRFSWCRHYVAVDDGGAVLSILASHDGRRIWCDDLHIAWRLMRSFGPRRTTGMLLRGLVLERELPKPARNQTLMAHCATAGWARSRGIFSALFQHALESDFFNLAGGTRRLVLDVLASNRLARLLYERQGFVAASAERSTSDRLPRALRSTRMALFDERPDAQ
jgi:ribosomal protein S18 acetylase RimI-like enzyme